MDGFSSIDDVGTHAAQVSIRDATGTAIVVALRGHVVVLADASSQSAPPMGADATRPNAQRNVGVRIRAGQYVRVLGLASEPVVDDTPYRGGAPRALEPVPGVPITIETEAASVAIEQWRARIRRVHVVAAVLALAPIGLSASFDGRLAVEGVWSALLGFGVLATAASRPWWLDPKYASARMRARRAGAT